jgi:hypothetical protein
VVHVGIVESGSEIGSTAGVTVRGRERIEAYFAACGSGDPARIAEHFAPNAVIYDTNHPPVRGAVTIGSFWSSVRSRWGGATWRVDRYLGAGDEAAIEWTMHAPLPRPFTVRGSEWYRFDDSGRITEIRQYWTFDREHLDTELVEFPYPN